MWVSCSHLLRKSSHHRVICLIKLRALNTSTKLSKAKDLASRILADQEFKEKYPELYFLDTTSPLQCLQTLSQLSDQQLPFDTRVSLLEDAISRCRVKDIPRVAQNEVLRALKGKDKEFESNLTDYEINGPHSKVHNPSASNIQPQAESHLLEARKRLRTFNAFIHGMLNRNFTVPLHLACQGLYLAAEARSIPAIQNFIQFALLANYQLLENGSEHLGATIHSIRKWLESDGKHDGLALSRLFPSKIQFLTPNHTGNVSFRPLCSSLHVHFRSDYLYILQSLHGSQAVMRAWNDFQRSARWQELLETSSMDEKREISDVLHDVTEALTIAEDPQLAWLIVRGMDSEPDVVHKRTWSLLLDYPQYLTSMREGMTDILLQKFEEDIGKIEEMLSIRWTGGEEGTHVFVDEDGNPTVINEDFMSTNDTHR